jgi:hypothetical protein
MGSWYLIIVGHPSGAQLELHVQREDTNRRWQDWAVNARDAMPVGGTIKIATGNVNRDKKYAKHHPPVVPGPPVMLFLRHGAWHRQTIVAEDLRTFLHN